MGQAAEVASRTQNANVINIDDITAIPRSEALTLVAKKIADENLEYVNNHDIPAHPKDSFYSRYGKRILDIIISSIALIVLFPVNLILGICTFFDVGRPIFFMQTRIGKNGKPFTIVKFRNMRNDTDVNGNLLPPAKRVTRFGKFVRKTSLDELLNFWSIFKGDMSVIGPRPLSGNYVQRYSERHKARLAVRPGLECPIIHKLDHAPSWKDQFENDVYYVENISFALDVKMVFYLIKMVFDSKTNNTRGTATRGSFMGYEKNGECVNSRRVPLRYVEELLITE